MQISVAEILWLNEDSLCQMSVGAICKVGSQAELLAALFQIPLLAYDNFLWERNTGKTISKKNLLPCQKRDSPAVSGKTPAWEKLELHVMHMFSLLKNATHVKAVWDLLFVIPHSWQWCWDSVCSELGIWFLLLGRGFSTLSHILALPWMFNFNGRFRR